MSHSHDDTAPVEHDPTGMRALLASLPEPGPMPDDLVARISAALAVEAQRGNGIDRLWSLDQHAEWLAGYAALGFDELYLHFVGQDQAPFIEAFGADVLPQLRPANVPDARVKEATP